MVYLYVNPFIIIIITFTDWVFECVDNYLLFNTIKTFQNTINICVFSFSYILFTMFLIIIHNIVQPRTDLMGELVRINNEQWKFDLLVQQYSCSIVSYIPLIDNETYQN